MIRHLSLLAAACALFMAGGSGDTRPKHRDQDLAFEATQQGKIMPLRLIEARIIPQMRGADYLGPELDAGSNRYRLKFLRGDRVIWVDVDARSGRILAKSGD